MNTEQIEWALAQTAGPYIDAEVGSKEEARLLKVILRLSWMKILDRLMIGWAT